MKTLLILAALFSTSFVYAEEEIAPPTELSSETSRDISSAPAVSPPISIYSTPHCEEGERLDIEKDENGRDLSSCVKVEN